jgi:hypothetical protein
VTVLAPLLRSWWARAGAPESGPVFPVRKGKLVEAANDDASTDAVVARAANRHGR